MSAQVRNAPKVFGPFEVIEKIGRGGSATVYKVKHRTSCEIAALKVTPRLLKLTPDTVKRFSREFTIIGPLSHPCIVRALDWGEDDGHSYLAMEYVPGQNLEQRLKDQGALTAEQTVAIFLQVVDGLSFLHKNHILHRDIKPSNIFVTDDNHAKLGDFGLLKHLTDDSNLTRSRQGMGTIEYGAPEQFEDAKHVDLRCDLYSLGATIYTAITGKFPFGNGGQMQILQRKFFNQFVPLRMLVPGLDPALDQLVSRCLQPDPSGRPRGCEEFQKVLRNYRPVPTDPSAAEGAAFQAVRPRDRRASVRFAVDLTTTFVPFHQNMRGRFDAAILDVSAHGVRLRSSRAMAINSVLQITLGQTGRTELAVVRWVEPGKGESQFVGCSFIHPLTEEDFQSLYRPKSDKK